MNANRACFSLNRRPPFFLVLAGWCLLGVMPIEHAAAEPCLQPGDTVGFLGGEDTVRMQEHGYLELLLTASHSPSPVRFRSLAWEGDTVFEQRRDLNFGSWPDQIQRAGINVVLAQFGGSELLRGTDPITVDAFVDAYRRLLEVWEAHTDRVILLSPTPLEPGRSPVPRLEEQAAHLDVYVVALQRLAEERGLRLIDLRPPIEELRKRGLSWTRDGVHLNGLGHWAVAREVAMRCGGAPPAALAGWDVEGHRLQSERWEAMRQLIVEKNRLWFDYWRPMNWAFLAGDRTEQPSSRDHRDPSVRWFPKEMQDFLPLIAAKEKAIDHQLNLLLP